MADKKRAVFDVLPEEYTTFQKGLDLQRENFKEANLNNDFESMVRVLQNIKTEIKNKVISKGNGKQIDRINNIINWYFELPLRYSVRTEEGNIINYPINIEIKINKNLNIAYEIIIELLSMLSYL